MYACLAAGMQACAYKCVRVRLLRILEGACVYVWGMTCVHTGKGTCGCTIQEAELKLAEEEAEVGWKERANTMKERVRQEGLRA